MTARDREIAELPIVSVREITDLQIRATAIYADNCDSPLWDKILAPMRPYVQGAK